MKTFKPYTEWMKENHLELVKKFCFKEEVGESFEEFAFKEHKEQYFMEDNHVTDVQIKYTSTKYY